MFADDTTAAGPLADFIPVGAPIIPEVTEEGKELVLVVKLTLIKPADD
jgi:hypothetical protein